MSLPISGSRTALYCRECEAQLTNWLRPIRSAKEMRDLCNLPCNAGEAPVPKGFALMLEGEVLEAYLKSRRNPPANKHPESWMNLDDVLATVTKVCDLTRLSGCCGLDGVDGPNRACACGAEVGTEQSDFWTWQLFVAHRENTIWK